MAGPLYPPIESHQDLLDVYIGSELACIGEYSSNFNRDWKALIAQVEPYAEANGLNTTELDNIRNILRESKDGA